MATDLQAMVARAPLADTHEHQCSAAEWASSPPDPLADVFDWYTRADLCSAGAPDDVLAALDDSAGDPGARFERLAPWWSAIAQTGYGEAVRLAAAACYGLDELSAVGLRGAVEQAAAWRRPGGRDRLFREVAGLAGVQIDAFELQVPVDPDDPAFYRYDLNACAYAAGRWSVDELEALTGRRGATPDDLRAALAAAWAQQAPAAVAVKSQHAYERTLAWAPRTDAEVARLIAAHAAGKPLDAGQRMVLGDWCLARIAELCATHNLPLKLHTGHLAGNGQMQLEWVRPANLSPLLAQHPGTRFVLMHAGWPFSDELVSLAKHYANVWGDLCWAWAMAPSRTARLVRDWLHSAPANKLLVFGGDCGRPTQTVGFARQARRWLGRALAAEVDAGDLSEPAAIELAARLMSGNAAAVFGT